jgi:hypothetical protein
MAKGQKRARSEEMVRVSDSPEEELLSERDGVQFKIELPKHSRTCHLFDGSIAKAIYLRPSGVQGRNGKDGVPNKPSAPR